MIPLALSEGVCGVISDVDKVSLRERSDRRIYAVAGDRRRATDSSPLYGAQNDVVVRSFHTPSKDFRHAVFGRSAGLGVTSPGPATYRNEKK